MANSASGPSLEFEGQKDAKQHETLAAAWVVEHYAILRYGTLRTWAKVLGMTEAVTLLDATLAEEKATDSALSKLASSVINIKAEADL